METNIENPTIELQPAPRPQFLSVLCILTWVACGLTFLFTVIGVAFQKSPEQQMEDIEKIRSISPEAADQMEAALESQSGGGQAISTALSLVAVGFSAFGAYMMWKLRKMGFYLYLAGETIPYFGFAFGGAQALAAMGSMSGLGEAAGMMMIGVMVLFDLAFIIMYAVNLKYMTSTR